MATILALPQIPVLAAPPVKAASMEQISSPLQIVSKATTAGQAMLRAISVKLVGFTISNT